MTKKQSIESILKVMNKRLNEVKKFHQKNTEFERRNRLIDLECEAIISGTKNRLKLMGMSDNTIFRVFEGSRYRVKKEHLDDLEFYGFTELPFSDIPYDRKNVAIDYEGNIIGLLLEVDDLYNAGFVEEIS